jgi:hypothetical protein
VTQALLPVQGMTSASLIAYDTTRFPFAGWLARALFRVSQLDELHDAWRRHKAAKGLSSELGYADNLRLRALMQQLPDDSPFYTLYRGFVRRVIAPAFGGRISYASHPKMRVHLAGTPTVSKWHRDVTVTMRPELITVWLPFTSAFGSNTLWVESGYGTADHRPIDVAYGQALIFDGGYLEHGTVANCTAKSRVSVDFRFSTIGPDVPDELRAIYALRGEPSPAVSGDRGAGRRRA